MKIRVKTFFNGWREVDRNQAKNFILHLYSGIVTLSTDEKIKYINSKLDGITAESVLYSTETGRKV